MKNEEFLRDFFLEQKQDLRWRRNIELHLLQYVFALYPVLLIAWATLYTTKINSTAFFILSIGLSVFILLVSLVISIKIFSQHKIQKEISKDIKKIYN